jgi:hypothetical protein
MTDQTSAESMPQMVCPPLPTPVAKNPRIVFVGDVHGCSNGLREILEAAGIIGRGEGHCSRLDGSQDTLVVQLGDITDRGRNATAAWDCLDELQASSKKDKSIRILGKYVFLKL